MPTAKRRHYSYEDYLELLAVSTIKLEYRDGVIYAMAGGTVAHAALGAATIRALGAQLPPGSTVFTSDLKVRIEATDLSTFPDVSVVCGPVTTAARDAHAITNPALLVEVTSRSTEDYDRGDRLNHYEQLPSVRAVLFVSHREKRITVVERGAEGWLERDYRGGERALVPALALALDVDALYADITLDAS